jgi:hypothetical protein
MFSKKLYITEHELAYIEWVDCDKRKRELARPTTSENFKTKYQFTNWINKKVINKNGVFEF